MSKMRSVRRKFIFRTIIFFMVLLLYLFNQELLRKILNYDFNYFKLFHVIWVFLLMEMLQVLLPNFNNYISSGKIFARHFVEKPCDKGVLQGYRKTYNIRAFWAGLFWLTLLTGIGFLFFSGKIDVITIHFIVAFFYFSDEFCINIWCPFGAWIVRNRCCNTCRIHNWNYFMIYSPYIFIISFWTFSLLLTGLIILLQWEYLHHRYPQRVSEFSNANLQCSRCPDEGSATCRFS